jgi:hypothetical protein
MELILAYFQKAINALLRMFGEDELDTEVIDNIKSMIGNILGYDPTAE